MVCCYAKVSLHLTNLVGLVDSFFNSVVVIVPYSLIFWHFSLFINFRLVVIFLLVVLGSERFLPVPPSWPELKEIIFILKLENMLSHLNVIKEEIDLNH